jgi:hypothetical protein
MAAEVDMPGKAWIARRVVRLPRLFPQIVYVCRPRPAADEDAAAAREAAGRETLEGLNLVVSCDSCVEPHLGMHKFYIDLADEVLVVNRGGRVDAEQAREIEYAKRAGKVVRYVEES